VDERVIDAIKTFREGKVRVIPGGGGQYGKVELGGAAPDKAPESQKSLFDFKEV
jgi:PHP family Zn ribbon phosphoesterase